MTAMQTGEFFMGVTFMRLPCVEDRFCNFPGLPGFLSGENRELSLDSRQLRLAKNPAMLYSCPWWL
jgi:hypothetical protein